MASVIYLLHFDRPYRHARHYLGYTDNLEQRLADHRSGRGAKLTAAASAAGVVFTVARTWRGKRANRTYERQLHKQKMSPRLCPLCNGSPANTSARRPR